MAKRRAFGEEKPPARDKWITLRVTEEELALLQRRAAKEGLTVATLIRAILSNVLAK